EGDVSRAEALLDQCPQERRHWAWHYLKGQCHAPLLTFKGHKALVTSLACSPDGKRVASASLDGALKVWDPATGRPLLSWYVREASVHALAFSPDGKRLASQTSTGTVQVWDPETGRRLLAIPNRSQKSELACLAYSPDGRRLAATGPRHTAKVWDADSG